FSGAGVYDPRQGAVVGMVVVASAEPGRNNAQFINVASLLQGLGRTVTSVAPPLDQPRTITLTVAELAAREQHDAAIRAGIVEPLDFSIASPLSQKQFLLGVDTTPSHVAASLGVERREDEATIVLGVKEDGYVVIVGPSGSGKSALLWRSARNC